MGINEKEAIQGKKMIEIKLRFWTDEIAESKGKIIPKHCWDTGVVRIARNDLHGITPDAPIPFNSLLEILSKIEKVLENHKIKLHRGGKAKRYYSD